MCKRNGNPKRMSRFICLKCLTENRLGEGIQRGKHQRSKYHVKDLTCFNCNGEVTKNLEVRFCDNYDEVFQKATEVRGEYYIKDGDNYVLQRPIAS